MNYRHIYHAGNFADVFKHIVLLRVLEYLRLKDKPFFVLDTHAGIGHYDLNAVQAQKTLEARDGIGSLWDMGQNVEMPQAVAAYLSFIQNYNGGARSLTRYPGSPAIIRANLRDGDRMIANELHPEDVVTLRDFLAGDARVRVESMDAYQLLKAALPPAERRGLVLVDPPFEVRDEFAQMVEGLRQAYKRFATGIYGFWYPIKNPAEIYEYHKAVKALNIPKCTAFDFYRQDADDVTRLNGCGMLMVNAPWTLADDIGAAGAVLVAHLTGGRGALRINTISD